MTEQPASFAAQWGLIDPAPDDREMRDIRERAMSHACYIAPEMSAFDAEDPEYLARLMKVADRIADWIKDGV